MAADERACSQVFQRPLIVFYEDTSLSYTCIPTVHNADLVVSCGVIASVECHS